MLETFRPLLEAAQGLDLSEPEQALAALDERFDPRSVEADSVRAELLALFEAGRLAERGELPVKWGRVAKASPESLGFSIDVVYMNGAGPRHRHPNGEVNFCIPVEGQPSFEGQTDGWVVMAPGSVHVPEVVGGTMLIAYLLPQGAIEFQESPG